MKRKEIEEKVTKLMEQILADHPVDLVDVEFVKESSDYFLRIYIDKEHGVTLDDCEEISRMLDQPLDEADLIRQKYYLEVSSPGLERPLKKKTDFQRNRGKRVEVRLYQPLNGTKKMEGVLIDKLENSIVIETDQHQQMEISDSQVALVKLAITF